MDEVQWNKSCDGRVQCALACQETVMVLLSASLWSQQAGFHQQQSTFVSGVGGDKTGSGKFSSCPGNMLDLTSILPQSTIFFEYFGCQLFDKTKWDQFSFQNTFQKEVCKSIFIKLYSSTGPNNKLVSHHAVPPHFTMVQEVTQISIVAQTGLLFVN